MLKWVVGAVSLLVVALAVGLWAFEPWRLFTSSRVDEALPAAEGAVATDPADAGSPGGTKAPAGDAKPEVVELGSGEFEDAEHETTGTAKVIELADGRRFVRLEGLASSDGPDLHVALSDAPSGGEWGSYDDDRYVALGDLKATHGNQNYEVPADVDLDGLTTVVIWCDRFNVAFGTAPIAA